MAPKMVPEGGNEQLVSASKEAIVVKNLKKFIESGGLDIESLGDEEAVRKILEEKKRLLLPGVTIDGVIAELKNTGVIKPIQVTPVAPVKKVEYIPTEFQKLDGPKMVEDEELRRTLEENNFFLELEKDVFKNEKDLDALFDQALSLGKEHSGEMEPEAYYYEFAEAGLIKGGAEEVKKDLESLGERKNQFKQKNESASGGKATSLEKNKKIATIVERAVAYGVTELGWYGDNVSIEPTSQFDDVKRGVDEVLEIRKESDESSFMGLGIDVTYRGLLGEKYKEKLFTLLQSIEDGHKTKIKYFKNHAGDKMREFSVPKIILFFNVEDVKEMARMVKHAGDAGTQEEFKNSPQKIAVMNQIMIQCELLANFAEESRNGIFKKYTEIVSSIKELAWNNPDIKAMLEARHEDEATVHMKYLIEQFRMGKGE